jgi:CelD/BcsL family acetyltransferase involved in cellulose biosynthesis
MTNNAPKISSVINKTLSLKLIDTFDAFQSLQQDWDTLYENCERNSVFSSWDWVFTWWEVFKDQFDRELFIIALYQDDKLVGLAPFQIYTPPSPKSFIQGKTLNFIGNGEASEDSIVSEFQDFIVLPEYESDMVQRVSEYLTTHSNKWNFADLEFLLKDALVLQCFDNSSDQTNKIKRYKMEYGVRFSIPKMKSFEQYQESMGSRWRKMYTKKGSKLLRGGEVATITTESLDSIMPALDQLAEMNCSRWREKVGDCIFDSSRFVKFHQKILARLIPKKRAAIKSLTLDNEVLASYYIFTDKDQVHYYQSGFNRTYGNKYSPLFLLVCNEIGESIKNNQKFDFMFADDANSYKKEQYSCEHEPMYRLRWSSQKHRLPLYHSAKYAQNTLASIKQTLQEKLNKKRGK